MVDFAVVPKGTALVNVDMQNCFVDRSPFSAPDGLVMLDRINRLALACRAAGILVIHASHVLRPDGSNSGVLGEIALIVKQGIINKGWESAALHKGLVIDRRDILLEKPRFGAVHGTDLELILRSRRIDTTIITGIATNFVAKRQRGRPRSATFACFSSAMSPSVSARSRPPTFKAPRAPPSDYSSAKC
jgi:ureidoacrylate peracid hydrolase